jgi:phage tail sheath protein FI
MPVQTTYPGVYVQELPSGTHSIAGVATSIAAFIGYLRRGPINTPVQVFNFGDFQRVFGGLDEESETSYQVSQFFLNGGTQAWVSRVVDAASPPAVPTVAVDGGSPSTSASALSPPAGGTTLTVSAASGGSWGENIFVTVDYLTPAGSLAFNLQASLYNMTSNGASLLQTTALNGVTMDPSQPNFILQKLQALSSSLIQIADSGPAVPFPSGTVLQFMTQSSAVTGAQLTVSVGAANSSSPPSVTVPLPPVLEFADFTGAVQSALAVAGAQLNLPALASAAVRPFFGWPGLPNPQASMIQIVMTDPTQAQNLIGFTQDNTTPSLFNQMQTNYQALQLSTTSSTPDGLPPTGIDIAGSSTARTGVYSLDAVGLVNILSVPDLRKMDTSDYLTSACALLNYALQRRAFAILDIPTLTASVSQIATWASATASFGPGVTNAAAYFPEMQVPDPLGAQPRQIGASGTMAGIYAATDTARGVWKAPAGIAAALAGVQQLAYVMTDQENGIINPMGINGLRTFPLYSNIAWGARTLAAINPANEDWKYINVRRLALYIEQSLVGGLQWVVFEPNGETLWAQIRLTVNSFLHPLFQQGAFVGSTPQQAYQVICDASTTTAEDMENGVVNILVLFAPIRPAEFVVISIQQMAGQSST